MSKLISKKSQTLDKELPQPRLVPDGERAEPIYRFGAFLLDTSERVLTRDGSPVPITPRAFDILLLLLTEHGRLVSKDRLMDTIWPDTFVEEKTLTQYIFTLRKVLGTDAAGQHYIETVPKHGYRFRAEVAIVSRHDDNGAERRTTAEFPKTFEAAPEENAVHQSGGTQAARPHVKLRLVALLLLTAAAVSGAVIFGRLYFQSRGTLAARAFQKINLARLTNGANISALALSPDGQYVAYAAMRGDRQSLFVRQVATTSAVEIVPPATVAYRGITFSRDGAWLYYVTTAPESFNGTLSRVPLLGGTAQTVLQGKVHSRVEFSPDGRRLAFVRWTDAKHTALMLANADGTVERQLAVLDYEDGFSINGPAWSPDGKTILSPTQSYNDAQAYASLVAVNVADGSTRTVSGGRWNWIGQVTWLADGSGVVLTAWNRDAETMSDQIWLMSYPAGEARRVTGDVNGYLGVSVSTDAKVIAASDSTPAKNFWVAPDGDWTQARKITNGAGELYSERFGLAWTPSGRIVYSTRQSGNPDIWLMEADGTGQRQLTFDAAADLQPVVSPDGRDIVFVSNRAGKDQLWRMDAKGGNPLLLANTEGAESPDISPDGEQVFYEGRAGGQSYIWRVSLRGGEPVRLTQDVAHMPAVSPDGKLVACLMPNGTPASVSLTLLSATDGRVVKQFETPLSGNTPALRWSPDGRAVTYVLTRQGVSNIWSQPLEGGAARALTDWKDDLIYRFDWSPDGRLLCERGMTTADVILIRNSGSE